MGAEVATYVPLFILTAVSSKQGEQEQAAVCIL